MLGTILAFYFIQVKYGPVSRFLSIHVEFLSLQISLVDNRPLSSGGFEVMQRENRTRCSGHIPHWNDVFRVTASMLCIKFLMKCCVASWLVSSIDNNSSLNAACCGDWYCDCGSCFTKFLVVRFAVKQLTNWNFSFICQVSLARRQQRDLAVFESSCHLSPGHDGGFTLSLFVAEC